MSHKVKRFYPIEKNSMAHTFQFHIGILFVCSFWWFIFGRTKESQRSFGFSINLDRYRFEMKMLQDFAQSRTDCCIWLISGWIWFNKWNKMKRIWTISTSQLSSQNYCSNCQCVRGPFATLISLHSNQIFQNVSVIIISKMATLNYVNKSITIWW